MTAHRGHKGVLAGFTLVEMILALAICATVALLAAGLIRVAASATDQRHDQRWTMQARQLGHERVGAALRSCSMVLDANDRQLVLWRGDRVPDGLPNPSELRFITWSQATREVSIFEADGPVGAATELAYPLSSDFVLIASQLAGTDALPGGVVLRNVKDVLVSGNAASWQQASLMRIRLELESERGQTALTVLGAARMRPRESS